MGLRTPLLAGQSQKMPNTGMAESNLLSLSYGKIIRRDIESSEGLVPASYETYQIVEPGDTVLRFTDLQNDQRSLRSGLVTERGIITSAYMSFTPSKHKLNPAFFAYLMRAVDLSKVFYRMGSGVRQSLNWSEFSLIRLPLPPLETQRRIADYLDRETAEIDAAVADLDKYVELLERRRTEVLIEETRIRAADSKTRIGRHAEVVLGKTLQLGAKQETDQLVNYVRAGNIQPNGVFAGEVKKMWMSPEEMFTLSIEPGDVLVVEGGAGYGRSLTIESGLPGWGFQNHVIRIRARRGWVGKFIDYTIRAHKADGLIDLLSVGATIPGLSSDRVRTLPIAFLNEAEQLKVVRNLDREMAEIDALIADSTKLRDLLIKRRSVLITEVVTGRKQV